MPRKSREMSSSGIYHIMLRGINRQDIFQDDEDMSKWIGTLGNYKSVCGYEVYGYCLMSNHIHLILREGKETVSQVIKRIGASYVYWYNMKYERCGHLFQDRYKSECVENDSSLLTVLRYILQNPVKAGIVKDPAKYRWSSYDEYIRQDSSLTDTGFVLGILSHDHVKAVGVFKEYMGEESKEMCLDDEIRKRRQVSDEEARKLIRKLSGSDNLQILQQLDKKDRNEIIKKLKGNDVSIRQLARITGVGRRIIEKV